MGLAKPTNEKKPVENSNNSEVINNTETEILNYEELLENLYDGAESIINSMQSGNSENESLISEPYHFSNDVYQEVKLLRLLDDIGTPLYAYKKIMEWAKDAYMSNYEFSSKQNSYQQTIKYLQNKLQFKICKPTTIPVTLKQDNLIIDVVVFDVKQMLMSLFDNTNLNQYQNLVVNSTDRFAKYEPDDNRFGEVNSGTWYNTAYKNCITDPDNDFLCPLVLASDKTTLSELGDLHVDAIFMTTSIFDIKVNGFHSQMYW